jgi:hypothetical protein
VYVFNHTIPKKKNFICFRFLVAHNTFVFFFFWWQLKEYHFRLALYAENLPLEISKLLECLHSYLIVYTLLHEGKSTMHTVPFCITWCFVRPKMLICFFCMNQVPGANLAEIPFIGTSGMYWCQGMTQHWIGNLVCLVFLIFHALPFHMYIWSCDSLPFTIFSLCNITSVFLHQTLFENMSCPTCCSRLIIFFTYLLL